TVLRVSLLRHTHDRVALGRKVRRQAGITEQRLDIGAGVHLHKHKRMSGRARKGWTADEIRRSVGAGAAIGGGHSQARHLRASVLRSLRDSGNIFRIAETLRSKLPRGASRARYFYAVIGKSADLDRAQQHQQKQRREQSYFRNALPALEPPPP